jgi:hypothetical protein
LSTACVPPKDTITKALAVPVSGLALLRSM